MDERVKAILSKGLLEGYAGKTSGGKVERGGFTFKSSDYLGPEGRYHDEWIAVLAGGGQEIVETKSGKRFTRLYAGGTVSAEELTRLGLTEKDIIGKGGKLVFFINMLGDKPRLDEKAEFKDDKWRYSYKILEIKSEIPVTVASEEIFYDETVVFVHYFILCPIK